MGREERDKRDAEMDAFWDIDALIPPRRAPRYVHDTEAVDITVEPSGVSRSTASSPVPPRTEEPERHFIPPHQPDAVEADDLYEPTDSLIRQVRVYRQKSAYRYYDDFVRDAVRLLSVKGVECPHVPFFSYVPQYSQMNRAQLEWYLWWRECFRRGEILTADYSYLLLYAYEIINLSGHMEPTQGQEALCRLWSTYRELFHQLDGYLPDWICDYSLIHHLPPPACFEGRTLFLIMSHCRLREFYIASAGDEGLVRALITLASDYDYRKSKFYTAENAPLYDTHIFGALLAVGRHRGEGGACFQMDKFALDRLDREAYRGALCAHHIKCRLDLQYTSFYCSQSIRGLITELIKYTENRIRIARGIRARLAVTPRYVEDKRIVDAYLAAHLPPGAPKTTPVEIPDYEKRYDLPKTTLSLDAAQRIEQESWETTERLIEAFEEENTAAPTEPLSVPTDHTEEMCAPETGAAPFAAAMHPYLTFLEAAMGEDPAAQRKAAEALCKMPEAIADAINTMAFDSLGDILLEEGARGYCVIPDYLSEVEKLLQIRKEDDHG